jgi:hypothetical protein
VTAPSLFRGYDHSRDASRCARASWPEWNAKGFP